MKTFIEGKLEDIGLNRNFAAPKRILAATDLSDGQFLIPHIVAQAKVSQATVTLVHAILPAEALPIDASSITYVDTAKIEYELQLQLEDMVKEIESHGVHCNMVLEHGFAADLIREQIGATGAERLLMASHGRGKLGQFLLGSVANQILGTVDIPVFLISHHEVGHMRPRRILHPVSLSGGYQASLDFAIDLARANNAELTLLHVAGTEAEKFIQPGCTINGVDAISRAILPDGLSQLPSVQVCVAFGNLVAAIRNTAADKEIDWIVLGVEEDRGTWPFAESTAYKVMAGADCPVITVRRQVHAHLLEKVPEHHALAMLV